MKKFLSLTLVAVMLLSTLMLSSCDFINKTKDFVHGVFGIGDDVRTTISEEEWNNALNVDKFTLIVHQGKYDNHILMDGKVIEIIETTAYYSQSMIIDLENGCLVQETSNGWVGYQANMTYYEEINLGNLGYVPDVNFSELVYNEETKAYTYENDSKSFSARFEDGNLVYAELRYKSSYTESWVEIKDIGTTVVNLPKYEILTDGVVAPNDAPADAVTTVTDEQFANIFNVNNCTIQWSFIGSGMTMTMTLEIVEEGMKMTLNLMGEEGSEYAANIDGKYYAIETNSDGQNVVYTGQGSEGIDIVSAILQMLEINNLDETTLAYNEQGRYYTMQAGADTLYFYFENGQINKIISVKAIGGSTTPYLEIPVVFSNFGTTKVDIPEYIIDDRDLIIEIPPTYQGIVTEEQWDAQLNAINYTVDSIATYTRISTGEYIGKYSTHFESAENGSVEIGHNYPHRAYLDDGVYNINYNEETGEYEATKTNYTTDDFTICGQSLGVRYEYSSFTYNEYQGRYEGVMVVDDIEYQLFVYFDENGTLVKIGMVAFVYDVDMRLEGDVTITDIGTTVVELPEYVIVE